LKFLPTDSAIFEASIVYRGLISDLIDHLTDACLAAQKINASQYSTAPWFNWGQKNQGEILLP
jgi:hypothetical protein